MSAAYKLRPDGSEPFRAVTLKDRSKIHEFKQQFEGRRLAASWQPVRARVVEDPRATHADYRELLAPTFSARAVEVLGDMLERCGEILPLDCEGGDYVIYNVLALSDALDVEASEVERYGRESGPMAVRRAVFRGDLLKEPIFKVREEPFVQVYVTDEFVDRVVGAGLTGFDFRPCEVRS